AAGEGRDGVGAKGPAGREGVAARPSCDDPRYRQEELAPEPLRLAARLAKRAEQPPMRAREREPAITVAFAHDQDADAAQREADDGGHRAVLAPPLADAARASEAVYARMSSSLARRRFRRLAGR